MASKKKHVKKTQKNRNKGKNSRQRNIKQIGKAQNHKKRTPKKVTKKNITNNKMLKNKVNNPLNTELLKILTKVIWLRAIRKTEPVVLISSKSNEDSRIAMIIK